MDPKNIIESSCLLFIFRHTSLRQIERFPLFPLSGSHSQKILHLAVHLERSVVFCGGMSEFSVVEFGTQRGENLFFLGGFPDDGLSGWSPLYEIMKQKYNIISLCLPHYSKGCKYKRWGYTFEELLTMLEITINQLSPDVPITFICHDWGAVIGLLYAQKFPQRVSRLILVDVGIRDRGISDPHQIWEIFLILLYQWWFCSAYIIAQFLGTPLGNCIFVLYMMLVTLCPFLKVCPTDTFHRPASEMTVEMCFIYFQYWKLIFQGHPIDLQMPTCPVLYLVSFFLLPLLHQPLCLSLSLSL
jgi:cis-3-alkyl-4-acyloxetan-2-one decarboxylase